MERLKDFEALNMKVFNNEDYVVDISKKTLFRNEEFDYIYCSHVLEHIEWYNIREVIKELIRITKKGGCIDIWIPDAKKILMLFNNVDQAKFYLQSELDWKNDKVKENVFLWINAKALYGINNKYQSWHKSLITEEMLKDIIQEEDIRTVEKIGNEKNIGIDHGCMNLGVRITK